jgi:hypothetical protein
MIREGIQRIRDEAQAEGDAMAQDGLGLAQTAGLEATPQVLTGLSASRELRTAAGQRGRRRVRYCEQDRSRARGARLDRVQPPVPR